ncbi:MAG TPA: hypothetical protein VK177_02555 [Flavobacteriales bacterium]|nr:hypothetical protein [Flavobacteriales bacterium]
MLSKTINKTIVFALLVIFTGYLRETFFVRVQWYEIVARGNATPPESYWLFSFLEKMSLDQLITTRYVATIFFIGVFWGLSMLMIKFFFMGNGFKTVNIIFLVVFGAGFFFYCLGYFLPWKKSFYELARWDIGLIETPLIIILLFPLLWLKQNEHLLKNKTIQ